MKEDFFWIIVFIAFIGGVLGYKLGEKLTIERAILVSSSDTGCVIEYDGQQYDYNF